MKKIFIMLIIFSGMYIQNSSAAKLSMSEDKTGNKSIEDVINQTINVLEVFQKRNNNAIKMLKYAKTEYNKITPKLPTKTQETDAHKKAYNMGKFLAKFLSDFVISNTDIFTQKKINFFFKKKFGVGTKKFTEAELTTLKANAIKVKDEDVFGKCIQCDAMTLK